MFKGSQIYCYNGLFLSEEDIENLHIQHANGIEFIKVLQNHHDVFGLNETSVVDVDKDKLLNSSLTSADDCFYIIRNGSLVIVPIKICYTIEKGGMILATYSEKNVRDANLKIVLQYGVNSIIDDMANSQNFINEFAKQQKIKKLYRSLTFNV